jgi:drug/metabolite transporter (DMT)-like permease
MAKNTNLIGAWAFLIGVLLAIIVGIFQLGANETLSVILVVLGIIIGVLNITGTEIKEFMIAGTVLVIVSALGGQSYLGLIPYVGDTLRALVVLFVPATIVVALKAVFSLAKR